MKFRPKEIALAAAIIVGSLPGLAGAFADCPDNSVSGYTCTELKGVGKNGGYFRVTIPSDWDGDLVIVNHGFDLNDKHIRPHEVCGLDRTQACEEDADCAGTGNFCNNISYSGVDEILLPKRKAVAAGTYSQSGWAVFESAKDLKDIIKFVEKHDTYGGQLKRVIVTGFSLGGAVTGDATLKLKIDGAVPLCAAVGGGLPTWDLAQDVRLVYDFLCDDVPGAKFAKAPDIGLENDPNDPDGDATSMALQVDACFGIIGFYPTEDPAAQAQRLSDFLALTQFSGMDYGDGFTLAQAMGFATLGLGDFVQDEDRLDNKRIGLNIVDDIGLDYSAMGGGSPLATELDLGIKRLEKGKGRAKLRKASWPDFVKGKGAKVEYPIMMMAGAADWLVLPEFGRVYTTALADGGKDYVQTWIDTFGHCVFSQEETTAVFNKYFEWIGPAEGLPRGAKPTPDDVKAECIAVGGVEGDTCNFNSAFEPGAIFDRIPARPDWPYAATH